VRRAAPNGTDEVVGRPPSWHQAARRRRRRYRGAWPGQCGRHAGFGLARDRPLDARADAGERRRGFEDPDGCGSIMSRLPFPGPHCGDSVSRRRPLERRRAARPARAPRASGGWDLVADSARCYEPHRRSIGATGARAVARPRRGTRHRPPVGANEWAPAKSW